MTSVRLTALILAGYGVAACAAQPPAPAATPASPPSAAAATTGAEPSTTPAATGERLGMVGIRRLDVPYVAESKLRKFFDGLQKTGIMVRDKECGGNLWNVEIVTQTSVTLGQQGESASGHKCTIQFGRITAVFDENGAPTIYRQRR